MCPTQPDFHSCFPNESSGLLRCTYYLNKQRTQYVSIYLNDDNLKPEGKFGTTSGHAVPNEIHWFILVTFRSDVPKNEVHEFGDSQHTLPVYCGRYMRITCENTKVHLRKNDWQHLIDLASACIDREVIIYARPLISISFGMN